MEKTNLTFPYVNQLPGGWSISKFNELLEGKVQTGVYKPPSFHGKGTKIINMGELFAYSRIYQPPMKRVQLDDKEVDRYTVKDGDLLFARRSLVAEGAGRCSLVVGDGEHRVFESSIIRARPDRNKVDSGYIFYFFQSIYGRNLMATILRQVAVSGITGTDLSNLQLPIPPLPEQKSISTMLGALDDKISINNKINHILKQITQVIFKRWFVQFEFPNEEGMPYKSSGGKMINSGHVLIPYGWKVVSIYELADVIYGAPFSSRIFNENGDGRPLIRIRDLATHEPTTFTTEHHSKETVILDGDIVVGMDGEFRVHQWHGPPSLLNQRLCKFIPRPNIPRTYLALALIEPFAFFERSKTGTTVIHVGKSDIDTIKILLPSPSVLSNFAEIVEPISRLIINNAHESDILSKTRDALIPKLVSGKIRLERKQVLRVD